MEGAAEGWSVRESVWLVRCGAVSSEEYLSGQTSGPNSDMPVNENVHEVLVGMSDDFCTVKRITPGVAAGVAFFLFPVGGPELWECPGGVLRMIPGPR